ncbi:hypothetical protein LEHPIFIF_00016 [Aeromonas phage avDM9-HANS]|nr:hypothetical protein LEHPIFIF_00016 [Aeromonas phage avDM9-HANS]
MLCFRSDGDSALKEKHHILPVGVFPEYADLKEHPWNGCELTYIDHCRAHHFIANAIDDGPAWAAVAAITNLVSFQETRKCITNADKKEIKFIREIAAKQYKGEKHHCYGRILPRGEKAYMYGHKHTKEAREKMSKALKGLKRSDEAKENISKALKGKTYQRTHSRWNEEKFDLYELWIKSGKLKKVKFSKWLLENSSYNYSRNELHHLVKEFADKGFVPPENTTL